MSATDLRAMIEHASNWAEEQFVRNGEVLPMWHAVKSNGEHMIIPAPNTDKDIAAMLVRALFELHDVVVCIFISEAWIATGGEELRAYVERHHRIENYVGRVEVVAFMGEGENGQITAQRKIDRSGGKPRLEALEFVTEQMSSWQSEGRLVGMLPRRAGTKAQ